MKINEIRKVLEKEQQRLAVELGIYSGSESDTDRTVSPFNKKMEAASQISEYEQKLVNVRRIKQQIAEVEHALNKIQNGTYGTCDNCGKPIPEGRLKAIPQANLCLDCKTRQHQSLLRPGVR
jgi:DnaK suppressor protein